jgi:protein ImuB
MERFLCLALPTWSTDRVARRLARAALAPARGSARRPQRPPAIVLTARAHGGGAAPVVARRCERARAAGVALGSALAQARGLLLHEPLHVESHDPDGDAAALAALARAAQRFTPRAAVDRAPPALRRTRGAAAKDALLLEIGGSLRLFGGERALAAAALEWLATFGLVARVGVASTLGAAHALAHFAATPLARAAPGAEREALTPLPLEALRLGDDTVEALHELGLATVGDVLALPRHEVPARLGDDLLLRLDAALGRVPERLTRTSAPLVLECSRTFAGPVESRVALARAVRELVDELAQALADSERVCARLELRLWPSDASLTAAVTRDATGAAAPLALVRHASRAGRDAKLLWALFEHELERAPIGFGVERMQLLADDSAVARELQSDLLGERGGDGAGGHTSARDALRARELAALVDVLSGRLGAGAVSAAARRCDVREECVVVPRAPRADVLGADVSLAGASAGGARLRPTRLFEPPRPIEVLAVDGRPRAFADGGRRFELVHVDGPERLALPWWPSAPKSRAAAAPALLVHTERNRADFDGTLAPAATALRHQRDLFRARDDHGRLVWLVRAVVIADALARGDMSDADALARGDMFDANVHARAEAFDLDARLVELDRERGGPSQRVQAHDVAFAWYLHGEWC